LILVFCVFEGSWCPEERERERERELLTVIMQGRHMISIEREGERVEI
jgi:hypothetical protein